MGGICIKNGRRKSLWNKISIVMPFVGFYCGVMVGATGRGILWDGHPVDGVICGARVWFGFCALGLVAGGIALAKAERLWGVTVIGILLNACLFVLGLQFIGGR